MSFRPVPTARVLAGAAVVLLGCAAHAHAPHDVITELALSPSYAVDQTVFASVTLSDNNVFARSHDAGRSWKYIGTPMADIPPEEFAFSPNFLVDDTAFAANASSGLWRTQDGGLTWQPANAGITTLMVTGVAVSPDFASDRRVLAATNAGVFLSDDGGDTWAPSSNGLSEPSVRRVAIVRDALAGLTTFAAGNSFHVSPDGGQHWTTLGTFPRYVESLSVSPLFAQDTRVAVSFGRGGFGVAHSDDGGLHFSFTNNGLTDLFVEELDIAQDGSMFAATDTAGCFRTLTPGGPWQLLVQGFEEPSELTQVHNTEIVASPAFATDNVVFAGTFEGMYRSAAHGEAWLQLDVYSQLLNRCFVLSPHFETDPDLLVGNYGGGVFHYREQIQPGHHGPLAPGVGGPPAGGPAGSVSAGGAKRMIGAAATVTPPFEWEPRATGLSAPWASALAAGPGQPGQRLLLYGYSDLLQSSDEGLHWSSANKPRSVTVVRALTFSPQFDVDQTVFLGSGMTGSYRSLDGCHSWTELTDLPASMSTTAIAISPGFASDGQVFFGSRNFGVWRSLDGGDTFQQVSDGLPSVNVSALAISPDFVADRVLLAGTLTDGVWASADAGRHWVEASNGLPADPSGVQAIAFSPGYASDRTVFVALQNHGVWRSSDGALTWEATGPGLLGPPVALAVSTSFANDRTLFAGTFGGTCVSRDGGEHWESLPGYIRADDGHPSVHYESTWTTIGSIDEFASTLHVTTTPGATTVTEFFGGRIAWYTKLAPDGTIASVQIDDEPPVLVDTWDATTVTQVAAFERKFDNPGWHVIRVRHTGTANPASTGFNLRSDGFEHSW